MVLKKFHLENILDDKIFQSNVTTADFNPETGLVCGFEESGCINFAIMSDFISTEKIAKPESLIIFPTEGLKRLKWLSPSKLIGLSGDNKIYILDFTRSHIQSFLSPRGKITDVHQFDRIMIISVPQSVFGIDEESKCPLFELNHSFRNKPQLIMDVTVRDNNIYSTTFEKGRVWMWDIRNTKRQIKTIQTNSIYSVISTSRKEVFAVGNSTFFRGSKCLNHFELLPATLANNNYDPSDSDSTINNNVDADISIDVSLSNIISWKGSLQKIDLFNTAVWNKKNTLNFLSLSDGMFYKKTYSEIISYKIVEDNIIFILCKDGSVKIEKIRPAECI